MRSIREQLGVELVARGTHVLPQHLAAYGRPVRQFAHVSVGVRARLVEQRAVASQTDRAGALRTLPRRGRHVTVLFERGAQLVERVCVGCCDFAAPRPAERVFHQEPRVARVAVAGASEALCDAPGELQWLEPRHVRAADGRGQHPRRVRVPVRGILHDQVRHHALVLPQRHRAPLRRVDVHNEHVHQSRRIRLDMLMFQRVRAAPAP